MFRPLDLDVLMFSVRLVQEVVGEYTLVTRVYFYCDCAVDLDDNVDRTLPRGWKFCSDVHAKRVQALMPEEICIW